MDVYSKQKIVQVFVELHTEKGDFRVFEDSSVQMWFDWSNNWKKYDEFATFYNEIKNIGLEYLSEHQD